MCVCVCVCVCVLLSFILFYRVLFIDGLFFPLFSSYVIIVFMPHNFSMYSARLCLCLVCAHAIIVLFLFFFAFVLF